MSEIKFKTCVVCKSEKRLSEFNKRTTSKDGFQNICRTCSAIRSKLHYEKDKEGNKTRLARNRKIAQDAARLYVLDYLRTNGCVDCPEKDPIVLDFDHLRDKKCGISKMIHNGTSIQKIVEEIEKCEVRCANCHRRKTAKDFDWWKFSSEYSDII